MNYNFTNITILIAEDDKCNQFFFKAIFKPTNAKIIIAEDGQQAIEYLENNPDIQIALLDIKMPVLDGLKAARIIKNKFKNLPLIAQTAYSDQSQRKTALEAGFDQFITKPINQDELFKLIKSYQFKLRRSKYHTIPYLSDLT